MSNSPAPNPNVPQIPQPLANVGALAVSVQFLKQAMDSLGGYRGKPNDRAVTFNDLLNLGMVTNTGTTGSVSSGIVATTTTVLPTIGPQEILGLGGTVSARATSIDLGSGLSINAGGTLIVTFPSAVTTVVAGAGLNGGTITSSGTISLGTIGAGLLMANPSAGAAVPVGVTVGTGLSLNAGGTLSSTVTSGIASVVAGAGLNGGTITSSGTISLGTIGAGLIMANPSVGAAVPVGVTVGSGLTLNAGGTLFATVTGGVTSVVAGAGLAGGTITNTGTISLGTIAASSLMGNPSVGAAVPGAVTVGSNLSLNAGGTLGVTANPTITGSLTVDGLIVPNGTIGVQGNASGSPTQAGSIGEIMISYGFGSSTGTTVTISNGTPCVITWTAHGLIGCQPVYFGTTGALPSPLAANTVYYTVPSSITANTFEIATTPANAFAGTAIATTTAGSGTQAALNQVLMAPSTAVNICALQLTTGIWLYLGWAQFNNIIGADAADAVFGVGPNSGSYASPAVNQLNYSGYIINTFNLPSGSAIIHVTAATEIVYAVGQQSSSGEWSSSGIMQAVRIG